MTGHPHKGKRSAWISEVVHPTLPGMYETIPYTPNVAIEVLYWNGYIWMFPFAPFDRAHFGWRSPGFMGFWRGLAEKIEEGEEPKP